MIPALFRAFWKVGPRPGAFLLAALLLAACASQVFLGISPALAGDGITVGLAVPSPTAAPTPAPTDSPIPVFLPTGLRPEVLPSTYLPDTCAYLRRRWDPAGSQPGTVVAPFFFHSVRKAGQPIPEGDTTTISAEDFASFMEHAHALGFQTVTASQLANFLDHNAKIPPRSMILIVDDRRPGVVRQHFLPFLDKFNWTVTLGYIPGAAMQWEWDELKRLNATGRLDVQAHGFLHNGSTYFNQNTPDATILREIYAPIPLLRWHFGSDPVAFIWPGGDFTRRAIEVARQAHYQVGFTIFARGPLLFNWIPQGPEERAMGSPLMLLPRYWSTAAWPSLDSAAQIGDQARAFAEQNREPEMQWMKQNCQ